MSRLSRDLVEIRATNVTIEARFGRDKVEIRSRNVEIESRFGRDYGDKCRD